MNASLYAEANVKEYWILFGKERQTEAYRRPENGRYQERTLAGENDTLQSVVVPVARRCYLELNESDPGRTTR